MAAGVALSDVPVCGWCHWDPTWTTLLGITCGSHHPETAEDVWFP